MSDAARFLVFEAGIAAGLPVGLVVLIRYLLATNLQIVDFLGDGQLCLYATTLSSIGIWEVTSAPQAGAPFDDVWVIIGLGFTTLLATVTWAIAVIAEHHDGIAGGYLVQKRVTKFSVALAIGALLLNGTFRYLWGVL